VLGLRGFGRGRTAGDFRRPRRDAWRTSRRSAVGAWRASKRGTGQAGQVRPADDAGEAVSLGCRGAGEASARCSRKGGSRARTGGVRHREEGEK